jgi:hypothetical protein
VIVGEAADARRPSTGSDERPARVNIPPRRAVVLALWDSEEDGLLGSLY